MESGSTPSEAVGLLIPGWCSSLFFFFFFEYGVSTDYEPLVRGFAWGLS